MIGQITSLGGFLRNSEDRMIYWKTLFLVLVYVYLPDQVLILLEMFYRVFA